MATQEEIIHATQIDAPARVSELREAVERIRTLTDQVSEMREVLRANGNGEPIRIPPDINQYYARIRDSENEIQALQLRYGREALSMAMGPPQSAAEVLDAGTLAEFAKTQGFEFQSETTREVQFGFMLPSEEMMTLTLVRPDYSSPIQRARLELEGTEESQVISATEGIQLLSPEAQKDWADNTTEFSVNLAEKASEVADVTELFTQIAATPGTSFGLAEKLLAVHIEEQLRAGAHHIDLTQSYLTEDPKAAEARHTLALNNLLPLIETAQKSGVSFDEGRAVLVGKKFQEVIAVRPHEEAENKLSVSL